MALRIFDTDPDAKPVKRETTSFERPAFQFRSGMQRDKKPVSLSAWRVLTDDPAIAAGIAELYGGTPEEYDATKDMNLHVLTEANAVEIVIDGSAAIEDKLILWGPVGPIHECDGQYSLLPEDKGEPCGCPELMTERKERAKKKRGPAPSINVTFRLAGLGYELGVGKMIATAWTLAEVIHEVKDALDAVDGPALCELKLEHVEYDSPKFGRVSYHKPVITVLGSYNDAIGEER
ncbi:hypothetical protein DT019_08630 [Streptomyces sp. SDr-06]|uniref:hypothetical protein n=1 Tax=Streptomyces sp. SDr-06 TaxID=2267702 RepID=UPI000DE86237|nr:hypothetical protein [Streptomyces sp. SDr-06]RCH68730.1 hypothetical protein DT019_08630 [Streptomyces sp. SDr-06]